jgi:hypothetical protein
MSDYVKFSELRKPLQMSVIDAYSAMLFDFDNPRWYKQKPMYSMFSRWVVMYGGWENTLKVKYKQDRETHLGTRPVVMRVPELSFEPNRSTIFYPQQIFQTARYGESLNTRPLGIINQPNTLFYKAISETKYKDELQKVSTDFKKHFDSIIAYNSGHYHSGSLEMEKQVPIKDNAYGVKGYANVVLSILEGLRQLKDEIKNENIMRVYDNFFFFSLKDPIHSYTSGDDYMRTYRKTTNDVLKLFDKENLREYLAAEENEKSGRCLFYVMNGGIDELPYDDNMLHTTSMIPLRPYIVEGEYSPHATKEIKEMFESLWNIEETLIEGIELFVDSVSTMLNIYQDELRQEISRRLKPSYFSKWANEKGLTFQRVSGEMRTPSQNP